MRRFLTMSEKRYILILDPQYSLLKIGKGREFRSGHSLEWPKTGIVPQEENQVIIFKGPYGFDGSIDTSIPERASNWVVVQAETQPSTISYYPVFLSSCVVLFNGPKEGAIALLRTLLPEEKRALIAGTTQEGGYRSCRVATYAGSALVGDDGWAINPTPVGTAVSGEFGVSVARDTAKAGTNGWALCPRGPGGLAESLGFGVSVGDKGATVIAGHYGFARTGDSGTAKAGREGVAIAGDYGSAEVGDDGIAIVGLNGQAKAGTGGRIQISWWDNVNQRVRTTIGYVGENNVWCAFYKCNAEGVLVKAEGE